jgi:hypothetical protein
LGKRDNNYRERGDSLTDELKLLSSSELKRRLEHGNLVALERRCIEKVLKNGMQLWASSDGKTVIRRTIGKEIDFELVHRVLGENIMQGYKTYEEALGVAEWLTKK